MVAIEQEVNASRKTRDITDRRVQVFEQRYGRQATHLEALS